MFQLVQGHITSEKLQRKRENDRERDKKIRHFTTMLKNGEINVEQFLYAMSEKEMLPQTGENKMNFFSRTKNTWIFCQNIVFNRK